MIRHSSNHSRGISVLELLMGLAVLVVISAFAVPTLNRSAAKADVNTALEMMDQAVFLARDTAKSKHSNVVLFLDSDPRKEQHSIQLYFADPTLGLDSNALNQEFLFPPSVRIQSEFESVQFDSLGSVDYSTRVTLTSNRDSETTERFLIQ